MNSLQQASLVCAFSLSAAAAGQEVPGKFALVQETGIQCFQRLCDNHGGSLANRKRACYLCCTNHCAPNSTDCQDGCDRMKSVRDDDKHDHNEQGGLWRIYSTEPAFSGTELADDAACVLLAGMLGSTADTDVRWSLVVAGERLSTCTMPGDSRDALASAILNIATDLSACWKVRVTAVDVIGDNLAGDVLAVDALLQIIFDPKQHAEVRARAEEALERL